MGPEAARRCQLIALEGAQGPKLAKAARRLQRAVSKGGVEGNISEWDASGIFYEMDRGNREVANPSARTLVLLYAADLAFRLRWEIRPALAEGKCVIAAPYLESAIAFGRAAGLPRPWLMDVLRFAPKPQLCFRIKEQRVLPALMTDSGNALLGYLEFCSAALSTSPSPWNPGELRARFTAYLDTLERRSVCRTLTEKLLATGSLR